MTDGMRKEIILWDIQNEAFLEKSFSKSPSEALVSNSTKIKAHFDSLTIFQRFSAKFITHTTSNIVHYLD